jgi:GntR family transcriptional regulator, transcriptional repressor for pyruvate dehydrogenase complex
MTGQKGLLKNDFVPIKNRRLFEVVAGHLRDAVFKGQYQSGDRLPSEKELCQSFEVGRPVIREALRMLENSGILSIRPGAGGGIFVKKVDSDHLLNSFETIISLDRLTLHQITEARLVFERAVLPLVLERIEPGDIERLQESVNLAREGLTRRIPDPKNLEFHILLAEISRNPLLINITRALFEIVRKYLAQSELDFERKKHVLKDHEIILKLIKQKNHRKLSTFMEKHIKELNSLIPKGTVS